MTMKSYWVILSHLVFGESAFASPRISPQTRQRDPSIPVATAFSASSKLGSYDELRKRQMTSHQSTCGFNTGDPSQPRTAGPGDDCRVDTQNGLWGFCPTTVISASDCGLAGVCVDGSGCAGGCGLLGTSSITTFTCNQPGLDFCNTLLLIDGPDQTYSYIACSPSPGTGTLFAEPILTSVAASSASSSAPSTASASPATVSQTSASVSSLTSSSTVASSSSTSTDTVSPQSSLSAAPTSTPGINTNTPSPSPMSDTGAIVGGVLGGLALVGFFVLAALLLIRRQRMQVRREKMPLQPVQEWRQDGPKIYASYGPSELPGGREPVTAELPN